MISCPPHPQEPEPEPEELGHQSLKLTNELGFAPSAPMRPKVFRLGFRSKWKGKAGPNEVQSVLLSPS